MNLCFVCNEYPPAPYGGIGNGTRILARAAVRAGHSVRVVGVYRPQHAGSGFDVDEGVEVFRIATRRMDALSIRARSELYQMISGWARRGEIDVVEVPDPEGWAACWPSLPVPVVARIHGSVCYFASELDRPCSKLTYWTERNSLRRANFWSSVSSYAERTTRKVFDLKTPGTVIYPAVELAEQASWQDRDPNRVVYAGTLTLKKGILSLIKAWPLVQRANPKAELLVFGKETPAPDGRPMSEFLLSHMDTAIHSSVKFRGHAPKADMIGALRTARVAVYPSYAEAFAAAPMEAMAQGCPIVYSSRTSGGELIQDGVNGILIDPDQPQEIANAITNLLENETDARRIGQAGWEEIRSRFRSEAVIQELVKYYAECARQFTGETRETMGVCSSRS